MKSKITKKAEIGDSIARVEDDRLLKGAGRFVDDLSLPDMLYAQLVRSPHAHAKIKNIDVTLALSAKGVKLIVSGDDLEMAGIGKLKCLSFPKTDDVGTNIEIARLHPKLRKAAATFVKNAKDHSNAYVIKIVTGVRSLSKHKELRKKDTLKHDYKDSHHLNKRFDLL